jgi:MFS family permease
MPVVARDQLDAGASGYGVLLACVGVGGLAGALFLAAVGRHLRRGRLLMGSSLAFALFLILFALSRNEWVARGVLLVAGFMMIVNSALANGLLQGLVPDELRGRLLSVYSLVVVGLSQALGAIVTGAVARAVGVDWAIGGAAVVMLLFAAVTFRRHPELRAL